MARSDDGGEGELIAALRERYAEHLPPKLSPDEARSLFDRAGALMQEGKPLEALAALDRLILLSEPVPPSYYLLRATVRTLVGDVVFEYFDLRTASGADVADPVLAAMSPEERSRHEERLRTLEAIPRTEEQERAHGAATRYSVGMHALAAGNALEAVAHLTEAAAVHPDARIWFHCGVAAARALDVKSAAACFERLDACDAAQLEELYRAVPREKVAEVRAQATMLAGKVRHGQWRDRAAQLLLMALVLILLIAGWMFLRN